MLLKACVSLLAKGVREARYSTAFDKHRLSKHKIHGVWECKDLDVISFIISTKEAM